MRKLILSLSLVVVSMLSSLAIDMTNGVFCADSPIESHLISQNGASVTNQLAAGKTYMVGNALVEMVASTNTTIYFSGGTVIDITPTSTLTLNLFDQEVKNIDATPRKAEFGSHNMSLAFGNGEYSVIYPNIDPLSSITISTPFTSYQLNGGKYFFRVSDKSVVAYVLEGTMQVHGDKKVDKTEKGRIAMAIPFTDPASGIADKVISSVKALKPEESIRFSSPVQNVEKKIDNIQFFIVNGNVVGITMK